MAVREAWAPDVVAGWVAVSCLAQGVAVKIVDPLTVMLVGTLLGAGATGVVPTDARRGQGGAAAPRAGGTALRS